MSSSPAARPRAAGESSTAPGGHVIVVDTLTGHDDRLDQAAALARDYAAEQQAYHDGGRLEDPLPRPQRQTGETHSWAA